MEDPDPHRDDDVEESVADAPSASTGQAVAALDVQPPSRAASRLIRTVLVVRRRASGCDDLLQLEVEEELVPSLALSAAEAQPVREHAEELLPVSLVEFESSPVLTVTRPSRLTCCTGRSDPLVCMPDRAMSGSAEAADTKKRMMVEGSMIGWL